MRGLGDSDLRVNLMKKWFLLSVFLFGLAAFAQQTYTPGQLATSCNQVTTTGRCTVFRMPLVDADFPSQFTFQVLFDTGAAGSLSVNLEGSLDGSTGWTAIGNTTTLAGGSTPAGISAWKYIACNVVTYTLGTSHNLTCKFIAQTSTAGLGTHGLITPGDCTSWFNGTTLEDLGSPCGTGTGNEIGRASCRERV